MPELAHKIWVPDSHVRHNEGRQIAAIQKRLREYDDRLVFGRNEETGDWCIFVKMPPGYAPGGVPLELWPAVGFRQELPDPDYALHKLMEADTLRHGDRLIREAQREAERQQAARRAVAEEAEAIAAEGIESFLHRQGKTPYHRSLRKIDPKHRSHS